MGFSTVRKFAVPGRTSPLDSEPSARGAHKRGAWNIGFAPQKKIARISLEPRCGGSPDEESGRIGVK
jgi:hypothetical protein